jgi:hypothetical protein
MSQSNIALEPTPRDEADAPRLSAHVRRLVVTLRR